MAASRQPSYRIGPAPGKGLGAFATRAILKGELIIEDPPLLRVPQPPKAGAVREALARLPPKAQTDFWALVDKEPAKTPEGVFLCNFFEVDGDGGVYREICRFNHSCAPNCVHSYEAASDRGELRAVRDVAAGKELTVAYIELRQPCRLRRQELQEKYGFLCNCEACIAPSRESDFRRVWLRTLDDRLANCVKTVLAVHDVESRHLRAQATQEATRARGQAICWAAEVLRVSEEEGLAGADDTDSRACATVSFLLAAEPDLQAHWVTECLKRFAVGGCASDVQALRQELMGMALRAPPLPKLNFLSVD